MREQRRHASILSHFDSSPVLVSVNKDIYTNLALEHWLYTNIKFGLEADSSERRFQKPVVLIWTDEPCVVIGRHQNPWIESTLGFVEKAGVKLARRHSGGGCVYHDENNINISIIGDRKTFENRQDNLKFIAQILDNKYKIKCEPTKRHDLIHSESGFKVTGSAAKLGKHNSYHHFTILVDTDKEVLGTAIRQEQQNFIKTNSTLSTRSKVINLRDLKPDLEVDQVIADLVDEYNKLYRVEPVKQEARKNTVEGDQTDYASLSSMRDQLASWDWIYGMTPKFKLERLFTIIEDGLEKQVKINIQVNKGLFESIQIETDLTSGNPVEKFTYLLGTPFTYRDAMINVTKLLQADETNLSNASIGTDKLFVAFLLQLIQESNY